MGISAELSSVSVLFDVRLAVSGKIHLYSVKIHGFVWHTAQHRRVRGKEKLKIIIAGWQPARNDSGNENKWQRRGEEGIKIVLFVSAIA